MLQNCCSDLSLQGMLDQVLRWTADDAMAILSALNWDDMMEVIGITTLFGNVPTAMATENALILRDMAARSDSTVSAIPVVQGSSTSFIGQEKHRIADFVHGQDGFGNQRPALSTVRRLVCTL
jgi:uridine nucleosidase